MEIGRFAPTPSGQMHLGNAFSALLAWLDVRHVGGKMVLRIEDLDRQRCSREKAEQLLADLQWLGLDWDEGGLKPGYIQSERGAYYQREFEKLAELKLVYPCFCSRAERLAANAPHAADGSVVYGGHCRNLTAKERDRLCAAGRKAAWRVIVPDDEVALIDGNLGVYRENLARDCGDFIIRRADGVFAYQLAVVADDAAMQVSRVVRGSDLLSSAPRQIWLHRILGNTPPKFYHVPLLLAEDGRRLAKRDGALAIAELKKQHSPKEVTGWLAFWAGLLDEPVPVAASELISGFDWAKIAKEDITVGAECALLCDLPTNC